MKSSHTQSYTASLHWIIKLRRGSQERSTSLVRGFETQSPTAADSIAMQTAITTVLPALLLIGCLVSCHGGNIGCAIWLPHGEAEVRCQKCRAGNRMVDEHGPDPRKLCVPCEAGNYITEPAKYTCARCTKCTAPQVEKQPCTSSRDAVCGCQEGFFCADATCSRCTTLCGPGTGLTDNRAATCQVCPNGTFNDGKQQKCTPWRTSCPPGYRIATKGTGVSDITCKESNEINENKENKENKENNGIITLDVQGPNKGADLPAGADVNVIAVIGCLSLITISAIALVIMAACRARRRGQEKKTPREEQPTEKPNSDGARWEEQQVDCSLCHPQQEEGGSLSSDSSQGSKDKLLPV
ncbi:tumor necrosis factor receptor superfamily member 9-like [Conger conger]|uniref:tumor necrosis factor receptor superfamily member 9-like n=1 Tax=Conger conger TaxID=82655 RepID=UPI002A5A8407|nr:tumor necrosis factor receptor superfamily member 9-like [Conger conger]